MLWLKRPLLVVALASALLNVTSAPVAADDESDTARGPLQLTLPPACNAVVGHQVSIWFENLVLTQTPGDYRFTVEPKIGAVDARQWTFTPAAEDVGRRTLTITVNDKAGRPLGRGTTELRVAPADAGAGRAVSLLIVGDSLTHATLYPNALSRLMAAPGNPRVTFLGTHRPAGALEGVAHEGYGGWTWERFNTLFNATPDPNVKTRQSSPFVFARDDGKPTLDVGRYLKEHADGKPPDVVFFLLGINDCFSAKPDDPKALDAHIDRVFRQADTLLAAFRKAAPNADLALGLTTPGNVREAAFVANYKGNYPQWGWKRIQHRLVLRQIERFASREKERLFLVPTELPLDPLDGYPGNNAVHPNEKGYAQIAGAIHAWLKNRWQETASP